MVAILVMSAILATLGLLKIKLFQNKCYDIIISVHGMTKKLFQVNYIVDVDCLHPE